MSSRIAGCARDRSLRSLAMIAVLGAVGIVAPQPVQAEPSDMEQFMVELINRARTDPSAEATRLGLSGINEGSPTLGGDPYTIPAGPHQVVAFNPAISTAARDYAFDLNTSNVFCHTCLGTDAQDRMAAAGYVASVANFNFPGVARITGAYGTSNAGTFVPGRENLALRTESPSNGSINDLPSAVSFLHDELFKDLSVPSRGHRSTMLYGEWKEVGVGIEEGTDPGPVDSVYIVINFAHRSDKDPAITGLVWEDKDSSGFYTPNNGEGKGTVVISAVPAGGGNVVASTSSFASGGYTLTVPVGTYDVMFKGTGVFTTFLDVTVTAGPEGVPENTKLDMLVVPEPGAGIMQVVALAAIAAMARHRRRRA